MSNPVQNINVQKKQVSTAQLSFGESGTFNNQVDIHIDGVIKPSSIVFSRNIYNGNNFMNHTSDGVWTHN